MTHLSWLTIALLLLVSSAFAADAPAADEPAFTLSPVRVQTFKGFDFFYVAVEATFENIPLAFTQGTPKLEAAVKAAATRPAGPLVAVYVNAEAGKVFTLQLGHMVEPGAKPAGEAKVRALKPLKCASATYSGGLATFPQAVGQFMQAVTAKGLVPAGEYREYYLYWEGPESANNVIMLQFEVK